MAVIRRQNFSKKTPQKKALSQKLEQSPQNLVIILERPYPS